MNAVEIEEAVSELAAQPFDAAEFPFHFLAAFGNKDTTLKRLRSGSSNASDVLGGVLQRNNVHIAVAAVGAVGTALTALRHSPKTGSAKVKFILATDGAAFEAEDLLSGETIACDYADFAQHFGFFLPLAGISTVKEIKENPIDVKATGRLNKLYVELLKDNPDWATEARRPELNQFMARLIFCFFAEDTGIFAPQEFTDTIKQMSDGQAENTHEVLTELFRAMDMNKEERAAKKVRNWADRFPYVNGGLFNGTVDCPRFSRIARSYLLRAGELNWKEINPDIFGSMIQAVADDEERGDLGMHYTSVPNILKVLNPLFLDELRVQLGTAGDNARKLSNLRKRLSTMRVFDPACGSGNFLVIAYKEMRAIEAEIVRRMGTDQKRSAIMLENFYGIEIKGFAAEIARLALLIAEFQADCAYLSQQEARALVLPLHRTGQIRVGNALRVDWLEVCPSPAWVATEAAAFQANDNDVSPASDAETYICGNPPYGGSKLQSDAQKEDLRQSCSAHVQDWKSLDYVAGWFVKAVEYAKSQPCSAAYVSTNSVTQGQMVPVLWPYILASREIGFAHLSFKWSNLAGRNAGVTVVVIGIRAPSKSVKLLFDTEAGVTVQREVANINAYLIAGRNVIVAPQPGPRAPLGAMLFGNMPRDGGHLLLTTSERDQLVAADPRAARFVRDFVGSEDFINGKFRSCIWIAQADQESALEVPAIAARVAAVKQERQASKAASTRSFAERAFRFVQIQGVASEWSIVVPRVSSEVRPYLPVGLLNAHAIVADSALALYDAPLWNLALVASRIHLVWIAAVCGKLKTDFRYSSTLGWNTFPVPPFTTQDKRDLAQCAERILLAREAHFPATIAELYDSEGMPHNLRAAHETNDETLERIYVGRRFRNDTERLEKLFEMYGRSVTGRTIA